MSQITPTAHDVSEQRAYLLHLVDGLNRDELEALTYFADKLARGRVKHGPLDLATDTRDLAGEELRAELIDAAFYLVFHAIKVSRV